MTPRSLLAHLRGTLRRDVQSLLFATRHCRNAFAIVKAVLLRARESTVVLRDGTTFTAPELRTLLPLVDEIYVKREYERGHVRVEPGDVVVDIGAHVGVFSIYALARGASKVIAYEPAPANARYFRRNAETNRAASVQLVESAVGDRVGTVSMAIGRWSVGNIVVENVNSDGIGLALDVCSTTLDAIFADNELLHVDFLKIDCEGSEGAILAGASADVLRRIDRVALEYHDDWSRVNHVGIAQMLVNAGFQVDVARSGSKQYGMIYARRNQ